VARSSQPTARDRYYDLVLGVRLADVRSHVGRFVSVRISYHVGDRRYTYSTPTGGVVVAGRSCPA
jgi:hypothetical protein